MAFCRRPVVGCRVSIWLELADVWYYLPQNEAFSPNVVRDVGDATYAKARFKTASKQTTMEATTQQIRAPEVKLLWERALDGELSMEDAIKVARSKNQGRSEPVPEGDEENRG